MRRRILAILLFFALLAAATFGLLWLNGRTPVLESGGVLPDDLAAEQYALSGVQWDGAQGGYLLRLTGRAQEDLTLTVADFDQAEIFLWGEPVAAWDETGRYQRVESVNLPAESINRHGGVELLFRSSAWGSGAQELLSRRTMTLAKLLLGGAQQSGRTTALVFGFILFAVGLYALLTASSLVLYWKKPSETYLLVSAFVAAVTLLATLLTTNLSMLPMRRSVFYALRPLISICPIILHAAIGLSLYDDCAPAAVRKFLSVKTLLLLTAGAIVLRVLSNYSIYTALRWALMIPVVWTLSTACARKRPGAWAMLSGYALSEAVIALLFCINNFQAALPGVLLVELHMNQMSYLFVLLPAMFVINCRFAGKFQESERLSEELSALNATLDAQVEERTAQLREEQANRHRMMTNIFHDIRSPIFILQGTLDQLHPPAEEAPLKAAMAAKLDGLRRLTEDLFLLSKLEEDVVLYEENPMDGGALMKALFEANRPEAERAGVRLTLSCADEALPVWGDWQRLSQAMQNLIDNAFHFVSAGGTVALFARREGDEAALSVQDDGAGIAAADLPMIFERYYKRSRADDPRSSGLGLHIAKQIVEHHHGAISVQSAPGQGSCFTVKLPIL